MAAACLGGGGAGRGLAGPARPTIARAPARTRARRETRTNDRV